MQVNTDKLAAILTQAAAKVQTGEFTITDVLMLARDSFSAGVEAALVSVRDEINTLKKEG